ncbi:MAG: hypothetical protein ABI461_19960 [Polyangiaceae bacterium]
MSDYRGSKGIGLGLPVIALVGITAWFFLASSRGRLPTDDLAWLFGGGKSTRSIGTATAEAATDSAALLNTSPDGGVADRPASSPYASSSALKPDPAADPFVDPTPARSSTRRTHTHATGNQNVRNFPSWR